MVTLLSYWSRIIKARDKQCVFCGNTRISELESHHIIPKSRGSITKLLLENGVTLCRAFKGCEAHAKAHNTYEMKKWIKDYIGQDTYDKLDKLSYETKRWTPLEKRELLNEFKRKLEEFKND